eukprot:1146613-Pelagomonas_calceolata.AAC.5
MAGSAGKGVIRYDVLLDHHISLPTRLQGGGGAPWREGQVLRSGTAAAAASQMSKAEMHSYSCTVACNSAIMLKICCKENKTATLWESSNFTPSSTSEQRQTSCLTCDACQKHDIGQKAIKHSQKLA